MAFDIPEQEHLKAYANGIMMDAVFGGHELANLKGLWFGGYMSGLLAGKSISPSDYQKVINLLPASMRELPSGYKI